jgi:hypothetical protein
MSISLQGSLKTCKIDTSWAERLRSDRFENPDNMMCPVWSGRDLVGRPVSEDSFYTKLEGCNTPLDRVAVENTLRPQYMESITTDAYGFRSNLYSDPFEASPPACALAAEAMSGQPVPISTRPACPACPIYPYDWNEAQPALIADYSRHAQSLEHKMRSRALLHLSGFH